MPASTEPRSGLKFGWDLGESGWNADMNNNLLRLGRFGFHFSVKDRDLATPPASPAAGDTFLIAASPTGAWAGRAAGDAAVWTGSAWDYATPRQGWFCYIEDEQKLSVFKTGTGWSAGLAI